MRMGSIVKSRSLVPHVLIFAYGLFAIASPTQPGPQDTEQPMASVGQHEPAEVVMVHSRHDVREGHSIHLSK